MSVFVPGTDGEDREDYSAADSAATETPTTPVTETQTMTPEDIKQITDALEQLDWVQWVKTQMQGAAPAEPAPVVEPTLDPAPIAAASPAPSPSPSPSPLPDDETLPIKYSRLQGEISTLQRTVSTLNEQLEVERGRIEEERGKRVNTERYAALADCRRTRLFEIDAEFELVKYGKASDEQFAAHISRINANYREIPLDTSLPTEGAPTSPDRPGGSAAKEKYSKEISDRALAIAKRKAMRGEPVDFEEELEKVASGQEA